MPQAEKLERCICAHEEAALSAKARAVACAIVDALGCFGECAGTASQSSVALKCTADDSRRVRINLCKRHQEQVAGKEVR